MQVAQKSGANPVCNVDRDASWQRGMIGGQALHAKR